VLELACAKIIENEPVYLFFLMVLLKLPALIAAASVTCFGGVTMADLPVTNVTAN